MDSALRDAPDARNTRDPRDVLPRLSDRPTEAAATRIREALDIFDAAQPLPVPQGQQPSHALQTRQLPPSASIASSSQNSSSRHYFQQPNHEDSYPSISGFFPGLQRPQQHPQPQPYAHAQSHSHSHPFYSHAPSSSDSQDTTSSADTTASTDTDQLFTPPISEGGLSVGGNGSVNGNGTGASKAYGSGSGGNAPGLKQEHDFHGHESQQLLQLSELAATRARMADVHTPDNSNEAMAMALSRKRTADGSVKHTRNASSTSPVFKGGHSRNTSTVSMASTGSRINELSAELKTRLSYAMVKVNNGWQAHSIDQVENLASQATSPASSTSTIHGRNGTLGSPHLSGLPSSSHHRRQISSLSQASISSASTTVAPTSTHAGRTLPPIDTSMWSAPSSANSSSRPVHHASSLSTPPLPSPLAPPRSANAALPPGSLAPPASIQPSRPPALARRNSNPAFMPMSSSYSQQPSPHTPGPDAMMYSPIPNNQSHQNVREQDAIETLLFMSSPGNSANMKRFPASQPLPSSHHDSQPQQPYYQQSQQLPPMTASPQRHALPSSAPRRSLPTSRPNSHARGQSLSSLRRGGERTPDHHRSPSDMDLDDSFGTPSTVRGTPRRRVNGGYQGTPRLKVPLSMPSGLGGSSKPRPVIGEDDIEKMLDRAAADAADDSSDSDSEIMIPIRRTGPVGI